MNIFDNPFYKLGVSAKSNRRQISDKAEEKIFLNENESKSINEARNILIIPEKRLAAEIRWFPGVSDKNIREIVDYFAKLKAAQPTNKINMSLFRSVSLLNFAVYIFHFHNFKNTSQITKSIVAIDQCFKTVSLESLCTVINKDRLEAGFTMAKRPEVEREFNNYRIDIVKTLNETISTLSKEEYRKLVEELTGIYAGDTDLLIVSDLLDDYELSIMPELETLKQEIINTAANIQDKLSEKIVEYLSLMLEKWQELSKLLISVSKSRGSESSNIYNLTDEIFSTVRNNAINLHNEYDKSDEALKLMQVLKKYFAMIAEKFANKTNQDIRDLEKIINDRIKAEAKRREEWANSIKYETEWGLIFKNKLQISVDGILWNGHLTPLDAIIGINWGSIDKYSRRGYVGTKYTIAFHTLFSREIIHLNEKQHKQLSEIIDKFWLIFAEPFIIKMLNRLKNGETLSIGNIKFNDDGVFLEKKRLLPLGSTELKFFKWNEESLTTRLHNKGFFIEDSCLAIHVDSNNGEYFSEASYIHDMNTNLLGFIVNKFRGKYRYSKNPKLSRLLEPSD